jgi:sugar lactone lactonase YvrE
VYYTNTVQRLVGRVPVDQNTGKPTGDFQTLASGTNISVPDDLAVDSNDGSVYVSGPLAAPEGDTLQHIALTGEVTTVARGGLVSGTTAPALGYSKKYGRVAYLSTMGGFGENGQPKSGGRVVAVQLE